MSNDLVDRIEARRFVGREFLLWLWFESEVFEATLATRAHGSFGFWVEGRLVLAEGQESTTIKGSLPGLHREAKESLRRGKLPTMAGLHLSWADKEARFSLKGETMAIAGLKLPTALDKAEPAPVDLSKPPPARRKGKKQTVEAEEAAADHDEAENFYERMHLAREIEEIIEALYREFLDLRLSEAWDGSVLPTLNAWIDGTEIDSDAYRAARSGSRPPRKAGSRTRRG